MTSLDRAKQFLQNKARKLALTAVPLATLALAAVPAQAGQIGPDQCVVSGPGYISGSCFIQSLGTNVGADLNWLQLFGFSQTSGGSITFSNSGSSVSGGISAETIGVSWDFFIIDPGANGATWSVSYGIGTTGSGYVSGTQSGSTAGTDGTVQGSSSLVIPSGGALTSYGLSLTVDSQDPVFVSIPGGATLDLNPPSSGPATPEPASLLLTGAGLTALGLLRRRRNKA